MTKGQQAIRVLFQVVHDRIGKLPSLPASFPDGIAPQVVSEVFTGWRAGMARWPARAPDHPAGAVMALASGGMMVLGAGGVMWSEGAQPMILLVFGSIGLTLALSDWRDWRAGPITGRHESRGI